MRRPVLRWVLTVLIAALAGCATYQGAESGPTDAASADARAMPIPDPLFGLGDRDGFVMSSELIGRDFHILVRLPRSYAHGDRSYPMVLALDGGILFPMLAPFQLMMEAEGSADEVIVVGVSYGGLGFSNGNYRSTDYTAPSPNVEYFGGAAAYQRFLADELLPRLQRDYRIDASRRVLIGQSLGGQFAMHAALTAPGLFSDYIAVNPAIHANSDYFAALEAKPGEGTRTLVMAMGSEDPPRYREAAIEWLNERRSRSTPGLVIEVIDLPDAYHATSAPAAYHAVIRDRFPAPEDDDST